MEVKELIQKNTEAVRGFKGRIDGLDEGFQELKSRLRDMEQGSAGGFKASNVAGKSLAEKVRSHNAFEAFKAGNSKQAKMTFEGLDLLETKEGPNPIVGDDSDGTLVQPDRMPGIVPGAFRRLRVRDLLPVVGTTSNRIEVTRELAFTNNAAPQAGEGAEKAETDLTFDLVEASVVTVAHWQKVSRQVLDDQPALTMFLDRRLRYGVQLAEESQIVTGNGSGSNMSGLLENATSFNLDVTGAPKTDVIRRAIEQLELADWSATAILMNPGDWSEIVRLKDDESRYLFTSPRAATPPQLWGVPVVPTNSMPSGEFLVGDFTAAAILWDRMSPAVEMFEQDEDNVQRNLVTVRAEMRSTVTVVRPSALVKGSFGE